MNDKLKNLLGFVADRLSEQSTWKGIIGLLTAAGATLKPDQAANIIAGGIAVVAIINCFRNEKASTAKAVEAVLTEQPTPPPKP